MVGILLLVSGCNARPLARTFASGLTQPRGMVFDTEGNLFVAEAGSRGEAMPGETAAAINHSGRVLRISPDGQVHKVMEGLPYTYYDTTGDTGASDVALLRDQLYVLVGEGYDDDLSRTVLLASSLGAPQVVASILDFAIGVSTSLELQIGYVVSNPYAMVAGDDNTLYVSDGASGRILQITLDGAIRSFAELPLMPLTGMAFGPDGRLYVAMFSLRPHEPGNGAIYAVDDAGEMSVVVEDLTMPIDVGFDESGVMYVLEFSNGWHPERPYAAGSGRLLRFAEEDQGEVVLDGLNYPTAMAFSDRSDLYIAVGGAFSAAGDGRILRIACKSLGVREVCERS